MSETYILAGDGSSITSANINAPAPDYAKQSVFAVVENVLHIFGGYQWQDAYKVDLSSFHFSNPFRSPSLKDATSLNWLRD